MEIGPFKGFFSSLSQICQLNFEIWNGEGFVFSSGTDREKMPSLEELKAFSSQVVQGESFHTRFSEGRYAIFGVPIRNGDGIAGLLIAHGADDETRYQAGKAFSIRSREKEMELFLTYLAGLIEDKWTSQKETEELAEELSQSFSDLYLYSRMATQIKSLTYSNNMLNGLIEDLLDTMRVDLTFAELPQRSEYNVLAHRPEVSDKLQDERFFIRRLLGAMPDTMMSPEEHYFIINDSGSIPEYRNLHPEPYRFLAVKLQHNQEPYGWLGMVSFNLKEIFRRSELSLLTTVAEQIATVITNNCRNLFRHGGQ